MDVGGIAHAVRKRRAEDKLKGTALPVEIDSLPLRAVNKQRGERNGRDEYF